MDWSKAFIGKTGKYSDTMSVQRRLYLESWIGWPGS
jgi:hypothetical protein